MNKIIINKTKLGFMWPTSEPFLFCAHHLDYYPKGNDEFGPDPSLLKGRDMGQDFDPKNDWRMYHGKKVPGFPVHPHRGFETITIVLRGFIDHSDSLGAAGRYGEGDVQWMTAGKGVQHSEMFPLLNKDSSNTLELFQLWLNLPKSKKFTEPSYVMFWNKDIPVAVKSDTGGKKTEITLIAGDYNGIRAQSPPPDSWASEIDSNVRVWKLKMDAGAEFTIPVSNIENNMMLYVYRGNGMGIEGENIQNNLAVELLSEKDINLKNGNEESHLLFLQAKPIGEPVVQYGPFVMNTNEEIQQAYSDYRKTQFGGWPWERPDPVHDPKIKRFAIYDDGRTEYPE